MQFSHGDQDCLFCAGDLLMLLSVSSDEKILPTTYGELRPPLGKHRLKVRLYSCYKFYEPTNMEYSKPV